MYLPGKIDHDELPAYIAAFHVGVMPDSNDYGSPMKVFEYLAMGKPVVVPDYGPLLDVIEDNKEGMIFKKHDMMSLADCLDKILSDEALYERMSLLARRKIEEKHNWENNARAIVDLYEQRMKVAD